MTSKAFTEEPFFLYGMRVVVSPDIPKHRIDWTGVPCSPEVKQEMDAWCLSYFGTTNVLMPEQLLVMPDANRVYVRQEDFWKLQQAVLMKNIRDYDHG